MITNGWFNTVPAFVGITTPFPGEVDNNGVWELETSQSLIALCRHRPFASSPAMATKIDTEVNNWRAAWANKFVFLPWGIPNTTVNQGFGANVAHSFLILRHLLVAQAFPNLRNECLPRASKLYDHHTGLNPFSTSFVTGFGNWNAMPGHGRTREDGIGMVQPGYLRFGTSLNNTLLAEYADGTNQSSYRMTEGMIMESASLFPILAMLDAMQGGPPEVMPAVHLEAVDTNQLRLRWPTWASEWKLQQSTTLATGSWTNVLQPVIPATNSDLTTTLDPGSAPAMFFRLNWQ